MHFANKLATAALAVAAVGLAGCGGGVEGTYKLDKAEMKRVMEAEVAKMPADQQAFARLPLGMIDTMEVTWNLEPGGKLKSKATVPTLEPGKTPKMEEHEGTWKQEGETITIDSGDGKPLKCTKSGNKLSCTGDKKGEPAFVFVKG